TQLAGVIGANGCNATEISANIIIRIRMQKAKQGKIKICNAATVDTHKLSGCCFRKWSQCLWHSTQLFPIVTNPCITHRSQTRPNITHKLGQLSELTCEMT